jgi:hypothetical protein
LDQALIGSRGALPVLLPLCEQLHRATIINRPCSPEGAGPEAIDVGRLALVLILNRLHAPHPLVHVETWLASTVLPQMLGLVQRRPPGADPGHAAAASGCHLAGPGGGRHRDL